ncbi:MAG: hypothetical protein U9N59_06765 [Campylobacterota bacterium]|nr:hypothetical protein [Campylobacterota bacterium]
MINSPQKDIYKKDKEMFQFLETTNKNSVFVSYAKKLDISNIGKRAVFIGNGFPFNETYLKEYQERKELVFGKINDVNKLDGQWIGEKVVNYFRKKRPQDFLKIAKKYKLDYVVVESKYSSNFVAFRPKFENNEVKIYKISDFKEKR